MRSPTYDMLRFHHHAHDIFFSTPCSQATTRSVHYGYYTHVWPQSADLGTIAGRVLWRSGHVLVRFADALRGRRPWYQGLARLHSRARCMARCALHGIPSGQVVPQVHHRTGYVSAICHLLSNACSLTLWERSGYCVLHRRRRADSCVRAVLDLWRYAYFWLERYHAAHRSDLPAGRFITGLGVGSLSMAVPLYK